MAYIEFEILEDDELVNCCVCGERKLGRKKWVAKCGFVEEWEVGDVCVFGN